MKIHNHTNVHQFTPETAIDRALLEFPELTFDRRDEATRIFNRVAVTLTIKHNHTAIYRSGVQTMGFADDDQIFERGVEAMTAELLRRAAPDLAAWRTANPVPKPKDPISESITSGAEAHQES